MQLKLSCTAVSRSLATLHAAASSAALAQAVHITWNICQGLPQTVPLTVLIRIGLVDAGWMADGRVLRHEDCVAVHKLLLQGSLADSAAAEQWKASCRDVFTWSAYFDGARRLPLDKPVATADEPTANGVALSVDGIGSLHLSEMTEQ